MSDTDKHLYRPCVGILLLNDEGRVFAGKRVDVQGDHWQMPQGGIDDGETPRQAAMRELREETGTDKAKIIAESRAWLCYDLPEELRRRAWGGRYRGQSQRWFAMRFTGVDGDIRLDAHEPEFSEWRWSPYDSLVEDIIPFKREIYRAVVDEFRPIAQAIADDR